MVKDIDIFFNIAITVNTLSKVLAMNTEGAVHIFVIYQPPLWAYISQASHMYGHVGD